MLLGWRFWGLGVDGLWFLVVGFRLQVCDLWFVVAGCRFQVSGFGFVEY